MWAVKINDLKKSVKINDINGLQIVERWSLKNVGRGNNHDNMVLKMVEGKSVIAGPFPLHPPLS